MYSCCICGLALQSLKAYVLHCKLHRNEPGVVFKCVGLDCKRVFSRYPALKAHFYRSHTGKTLLSHGLSSDALKCTVSFCECRCDGVKGLVAHLKKHIEEGCPVNCPVMGCEMVFTVKSSFTAHMSRKHKQCPVDVISSACGSGAHSVACPSTITTVAIEEPACLSDAEQIVGDSNFDDLYLRNVCLFYAKLQGQYLVPTSTIQMIVEEMQNIHELGQMHTLNKLNSLLQDLVSDEISQTCHTGPMRTAYTRTKCFKDMLKYVEPKRLLLGTDENRDKRFAYYVPVLDTLKNMLTSGFWRGLMSENSVQSSPDVLSDCSDGKLFKSNSFFQDFPACLKLVLYQDAFEVVNPLGSARRKHKLTSLC
ncbi:Zinc finger protein ZXDC [Merluccius polli]|uniref:Zinc finger protein ZXDC n=1 Tax=Merluccius polli TaxID=89951 RepID=A0AA47NBY7_MERPO|nr:Zinc finger protein ZXDC [Merluccius polli]